MRKIALFLAIFCSVWGENFSFYVKNMVCVSCYEVVLGALEQIAGVKNIKIDLDSKMVNLEAGGVSSSDIINSLKQNGYDAELK